MAGRHVAVGRAHDGYGAGDRGRGWGWRQHPGGRVVVGHLGRALQNRTWGARLKVEGRHPVVQRFRFKYSVHCAMELGNGRFK